MWLGFVLLLALLMFIIWDGRRLRRAEVEPIPREKMQKGFAPTGLVLWHFWIGISGVCALLALTEWESPSNPPFTGRWGWLSSLAYGALGSRGVFWLWVLFAALALCGGVLLRHRVRTGERSAG